MNELYSLYLSKPCRDTCIERPAREVRPVYLNGMQSCIERISVIVTPDFTTKEVIDFDGDICHSRKRELQLCLLLEWVRAGSDRRQICLRQLCRRKHTSRMLQEYPKPDRVERRKCRVLRLRSVALEPGVMDTN